jgi:nucleotide-binding universal stress UspA family protein
VPDILPVEEGARFLTSAERVLQAATDLGSELGMSIRTVARVGHQVHRAILNTIEDDDIDMMVLGWRGWTAGARRVMGTTLDPTINQADCDTAVLKALGPIRQVERILAGVTGSPQNPLVVDTARAFGDYLGAAVTYAYIRRPGEEIDSLVTQRYVEPEDSSKRLPIAFWQAQSPAAELVRRSEGYDLLVLGSARESLMQQLTFGSVTQTLARHAKCSVLMVKKGPGRVRAIAREMFRPLEDGERTEIEVPEEE